MDIKKRNDETELEYHKRIIYGKLVDKTLSDIDYSELSECAYGKPYSSDVARRMFYGSRYTLDLVNNNNLSNTESDNILGEIEARVVELQKEQQKYKDQRREYSKLINKDARKEHLYNELINAAKNLNNTVGCIFKNNNIIYEYSANEAVLVFSDWHYGMKSENIYNEFNTDICVERVKNTVTQAMERIVLNKCNTLHIVFLGDEIHGAIRTSVRIASEELVCDQLMQVSEIMAQAIEKLSEAVDKTYVYTTYGNHGRIIQNKEDSIHKDNIERITSWWLKHRIQRDNVIIYDNENEFALFNVCGHDVYAAHGDLDNVTSSPRLLHTLFSTKYNKNIKYILLGDKHHRTGFEEFGITVYQSGSLCGTDEYANNKRLYSAPSQLLLIFNEDGVDAEYRIKC